VELEPFERAHVAVQVADELLYSTLEEIRTRLVTVDQRDLVAARDRVLDLLWPRESGTAEDQDVEGFLCVADVYRRLGRRRFTGHDARERVQAERGGRHGRCFEKGASIGRHGDILEGVCGSGSSREHEDVST